MSIQPDDRQHWHHSTAGQYLQATEQALHDKAIADLFGFNAVQIGAVEADLLRNSRIPNRYKTSACSVPATSHHVRCCDDFLPFADMSIDVLLLPHQLEFSERPHQTLREATRVMMPEGYLLISGFNPFSVWGAIAGWRKLFFGRKKRSVKYPWSGQFIGLARLKDWLTLLGFEILTVEVCCHIPPFEQMAWHKRFAFMDKFCARCCPVLGGVYFIVARKRVVGMTPLKPNWKTPRLKSALIARPTQSGDLPRRSKHIKKQHDT